MPRIPIYQQQSTPDALPTARVQAPGAIIGQAIEGAAGQIQGATMQVAGIIGQQRAQDAAIARQEAERKDRELREDGQLLALQAASEWEQTVSATRKSRELDMDEAGNMPPDLGIDTFLEDSRKAASSQLEKLGQVNRYAKLYAAPALERVNSNEANALLSAQEKRRNAYVNSAAKKGIDTDINLIQSSNNPQAEFQRLNGSWQAQLTRRNIDAAQMTEDRRISYEERDALKEYARQNFAAAAENADLQRLGPEGYLADRGLSADGTPLTIGRTLRAGSIAKGRWDKDIQDAAAEAGIDPALLAAVVARESAGNQNAVSPKGAIGLAQLMPGTAAELGVDPKDPRQNLRGGALYLGQMLARYNGDVDLALAAYNAGPGRVDEAGGIPNIKETREYVEAVKKNIERVSEPGKVSQTKGPASWQALKPDEQMKLRDMALRTVGQKRSERAEDMRLWFQNAEAMARSGNVPQGAPTFGEAVRVYGAKKGPQMWEQGQQLVRLGQSMSRLADASAQEIQAMAESMKPNPAEPETFAVRAAVAGDFARAAEQTLRERAKDPAAWAIQHNPDVLSASTALVAAEQSGDLASLQKAQSDFAGKLVAAQRRYGIAQPKLLTKGQADQLIQTFNDPATLANAPTEIRALQARWGEHWPEVYGQISNDLPPAVDVIASGIVPRAERALALLSPLKVEEMRKAVPVDAKRVIQQNIDAGLDMFSKSLAFQDPTEGRKKAVRWSGEAEKLALHYVTQGMDPDDASESALRDIVTSKYNFVQQSAKVRDPLGGISSIAPVYRVPAEHDADAVQRGADWHRVAINPADLIVPPGANREDWALEVKRKGYWITSPNEDGLELHLAGYRVIDGSGDPIRRTWAELSTPPPKLRREGFIVPTSSRAFALNPTSLFSRDK